MHLSDANATITMKPVTLVCMFFLYVACRSSDHHTDTDESLSSADSLSKYLYTYI